MRSPESHHTTDEENEAFERWQNFFDEENFAEGATAEAPTEATIEAPDEPASEAPSESPEAPSDSTKAEQSNELEKSFTQKELERIAKLTGRVPDDPEVIKLNMVLRANKYKDIYDMVAGMKESHTMIQQGTYEDLATAKREFEEAVYLYDGRFKEADDKIAALNEEERRHNIKDDYKYENSESIDLKKLRAEGKTPAEILEIKQDQERMYVDAQESRAALYHAKRKKIEGQKEEYASEIDRALVDGMAEDMKETEIYQTYNAYKDEMPEEPISSRRNGTEGIFDDDKNLDLTIRPKAIETINESENEPTEPDGEDQPDQPEGQPAEPEDEPTDPYNEYVEAIEDAAARHQEVENYQADMKEAADEIDAADQKGNKVEIGEINIKRVEKDIKIVTEERIKKLEQCLELLTPELGELYAKNRNLVTLPGHHEKFNKIKGQYEKILDEYLQSKAREVYNNEEIKISNELESSLERYRQEIEELLLDFAGGDLENTDKTQEELDAKKAELEDRAYEYLCEEYAEKSEKQKTEVNAAFLKELFAEQKKLEGATVDALENGNIARKFINKVLNNKALKVGLGVAAGAGLAITGAGLLAGTAAISVGFAGGASVAAGAAKGALSGLVMSRQSAEKSAANQFTNEEAMKSEFEKIAAEHDVTESASANVASWLLEQYSEANAADKSTNLKRTAASAIVGAALGGLMSGVQFNNVSQETVEAGKKFVGYDSVTKTYSPDLIDQVNIPEGAGFATTFEQLGGNPENFDQATEILLEVGKKYGVERVNSPLVADGPFAITHPGKIADWPAEAQTLAREVAQAWADNGLISRDVTRTVGQPVYDTITKTVTNIVPDAFRSFIARATGTLAAATAGAAIGELGTERSTTEAAEPATAEAATEASGEAPTPSTYDKLKNSLTSKGHGNTIGEDGIEFITAEPTSLTPELEERFTNYWDSLDDSYKNLVKSLITAHASILPSQNAFAEWLTNTGEL